MPYLINLLLTSLKHCLEPIYLIFRILYGFDLLQTLVESSLIRLKGVGCKGCSRCPCCSYSHIICRSRLIRWCYCLLLCLFKGEVGIFVSGPHHNHRLLSFLLLVLLDDEKGIVLEIHGSVIYFIIIIVLFSLIIIYCL